MSKTVWPKLIEGRRYRYEFRKPEQADDAEPYHAGMWTVQPKGINSAGAFRAYVMRWTKHGNTRATISDTGTV